MEILKKLEKKKIKAVILRGQILADRVYEDVGLRPWSDLDLLIRKEDWKEVVELFLKERYKPHALSLPLMERAFSSHFRVIPLHCNFHTPDVVIELHTDLIHLALPVRNMEEVWGRIQEVESEEGKIYLLSWEHLLINLCLHLNRFGFNRLLWFCDIHELVRKYGKEIDWEYLINFSRREEIEFSLYFTLKKVKKIYRSSIPAWVITRLYPSFLRSQLFKWVWENGEWLDWEARDNFFSAIWLRFLYLLSFQRWPEKFNYLKEVFFPSPKWVSQRENVPAESPILYFSYLTRLLKPFKFALRWWKKAPFPERRVRRRGSS